MTENLILLSPTDRERVRIYFNLVERFREIEDAVKQWAEAGSHPDITADQRSESERAVAEALEQVRLDDPEVQKRLPTKDMLHAYALEEIFVQLGQLRTEVRELSGTVEHGL